MFNYFLGLVILCFVKEVLTRQEAGLIKDFGALVAKTFGESFALPFDTSLENSERYEISNSTLRNKSFKKLSAHTRLCSFYAGN